MGWNPFPSKSEKEIVKAISEAEKNCSGEIRVHVDEYCKGDPMFKAANVFIHLDMTKTALRNGVLIYVAIRDKKFSIIGDVGINEAVDDDFWDKTKDIMTAKFMTGDIDGGIVEGVRHAGTQLKKFFPFKSDDSNELPNEISYGS